MNYKIGELVYLKTDPDQRKRMVVAIIIRKGNNGEYVEYELACGTEVTHHSDSEIANNVDVLYSLTNQ